MGLPEVGPLRPRDLVRFELRHGLPVALRVLRRRLGGRRAARAALALVWRSVVADPLRRVPAAGWPERRERLSRRQLRAVVVLDAVLRETLGLSGEEAADVAGEVVTESGALFVATLVPPLDPVAWRGASRAQRERFLRGVVSRFFNAEVAEDVEVEDGSAGFDVTACRFAEILRELGQPELAGAFCAADAVHFAREDVLVEFSRTTTIASGAPRCDFRFTLPGTGPGVAC